MGNIKDSHKTSKFGFAHNSFLIFFQMQTKTKEKAFADFNWKAESLCQPPPANLEGELQELGHRTVRVQFAQIEGTSNWPHL